MNKPYNTCQMAHNMALPPRRALRQQVAFNGKRTEKIYGGNMQRQSHIAKLAVRIESTVSWADLTLKESGYRRLQEIAAHIKHKPTMAESSGRISLGAGVIVLFTGPVCPGKTLAAAVLANDLNLVLYRVDLSKIVSKNIGETEKNLQRVFDAAEGAGVVLLFDEADALFGKRSEVKDSHDRYANIGINYLLQRIESYQGLAILSTNMKRTFDQAFLRRIRFVIEFPSSMDSRDDEGLDEFIAIPVGAFADPNFPVPVFSVYEGRMHSWVIPPEGAERFA